MRIVAIIFLLLFSIIGCKDDYHYLEANELDGVTLESHNHVYKVAIKIQAQATCATKLNVWISKGLRIVPLDKSVDTILTQDWYGEPLEFRLEYDTCVVKYPIIGIKFFD